ncbi:MAG: 1-acyl-sn-glycerol-3-phosphate acyltransferase [Candidatus Kapaibacterium sp.]|nr:MAG: 1-acyl-sn-glycerol-3-phosphate acyltransferase [Candidatus Kapabacteria bacterium]
MSHAQQYHWWEFAARAAAIVALTVWYGTLFLVRRCCGAPPALTYTIFPQWARAVLRAAGVRLQVRGTEHCQQGIPLVLVANHCSLFDIPVLMVASPVPVRILYKRELERVPFLGWALKCSTFIPVERERPQTAGKTVHTAIASLARDPAALIVFPEGTRSRDGSLGPFRRGAFAIAFATGRQLVPVAIIGSGQVLPPTTLRFNRGTIEVVFLPPVQPPPFRSRTDERQWIEHLRHNILAALDRAS